MREIRTSGLTRGSNGIGASRPLLSTLLYSVVKILNQGTHGLILLFKSCSFGDFSLSAQSEQSVVKSSFFAFKLPNPS